MNADGGPARYTDPDALAEWIVERAGPRLVFGLPLGVGKPNPLVNALYRRVRSDPNLSLQIVTALTLEPPTWAGELERRLVEPIARRLFDGHPELEYARDARRGALPANVQVVEFYFAPGSRLHVPQAQQDHVSTNYSQVARDVAERGINVVAQLVAPGRVDGRPVFSLGSNPDVAPDLLDRLRGDGRSVTTVGQVSRWMPFMHGDAVIDPGWLDAVLDAPELEFPLTGPPNQPVSLADHALGFYASTLVPDGGTLQIGIGSVADAVAWGLRLRHTRSDRYREVLEALDVRKRVGALVERLGGTAPFEEGLYGATEMFVPGYLELYRAGVLRRRVRERESSGEEHEAVLRAAFFLGPRSFYDALCEMDDGERSQFRMMRVSFTNRLGEAGGEMALRQHARFLNSAMMATLLGEVASDTLDDGRVVGGVGGQFDFASMAHRLPGGRSVLLVPSTRVGRGGLQSNIRWQVGHATLPRHLRDLLATEYGVADLRGRTDAETIDAVLSVTDARFQEDLVREAKRAGKLSSGYALPDPYRANRPEMLHERLARFRADGTLPDLPFGSDLQPEEVVLARALERLARAPRHRAFFRAARAFRTASRPPARARPYLERMRLDRPQGLEERTLQLALLAALRSEGVY
ncbi:MAG: acetyl-CoA hydrolase/transferase C-terminal domain-containing protein [Myxococcota bacterium]